jgi:phytanoyl-CoA dioxygenase PhyH
LSQLARARTPSGGAGFEAARRQWADRGYAIIEGCLPPEGCEALAAEIRAEYGRFARTRSHAVGGALSGHLNCFPGSGVRTLAQAAEQAGLTRLVSELHGAALELEHVGCNCNLPGSHYQTFHIDSPWSDPCMLVNVILVETNFTNGAIELVAGVDEGPLPYWKFVASRRSRRGVRHAMKPGDVLIRSSRVWHRGAPNYSDKMRPMLALTYWPPREGQVGIDYDQHGGKITFLPNRFGANLAGRTKEFTEAHLPWVSSALSFAGSLARRP